VAIHIEGTYPVSARPVSDGWSSPGLAFEDYARMSTQQRKQSNERRLVTPLWAMNDKLLRELIVKFMEERAGFRKFPKCSIKVKDVCHPNFWERVYNGQLLLQTQSQRLERAKAAIIAQRPRKIEILDKLCKDYITIKRLGLKPGTAADEWNYAREQPYLNVDDPSKGFLLEEEAEFDAEKKRKRELEIEIEGLDTYLRITENGSADIVAAIVYLYYRAGFDSVGVGAELALKPPHVRQTLWRLHDTAKKLWPSQASDIASSGNKDETGSSNGLLNTNQKPGDGSLVPGLPELLFEVQDVDAPMSDLQARTTQSPSW